VTPLNRFIGYENAAKAAKKALADGITVRQAVVELGFVGDGDGQVTETQLDEALDVLAMAYPHGR
jgi:fumarate hydratase, class II